MKMPDNKPFILGITPARGGSKGIPGKNIKMIAGKPLIAWTIESALRSKLLDRYIVSTEDKKIARISEKSGAEALKRPAGLAGDTSTTISVLQHALKYISPDIVVVLQATSPIRSPGLIDECITEFIRGGYDSLATGFICKYVAYGKNTLRRQDMKGFFYDDGNVYVVKSGLLKKGERFGRRQGKKIISRWENIEIDDEFDFWVAENILKKGRSRLA